MNFNYAYSISRTFGPQSFGFEREIKMNVPSQALSLTFVSLAPETGNAAVVANGAALMITLSDNSSKSVYCVEVCIVVLSEHSASFGTMG